MFSAVSFKLVNAIGETMIFYFFFFSQLSFQFIPLHQIDGRTDECNAAHNAYPSRELVIELHPIDIRAAKFLEQQYTDSSCISDKVDGGNEESHISFNLEAGYEALEEQSLETKINDVQAQTLEEQPVKGRQLQCIIIKAR